MNRAMACSAFLRLAASTSTIAAISSCEGCAWSSTLQQDWKHAGHVVALPKCWHSNSPCIFVSSSSLLARLSQEPVGGFMVCWVDQQDIMTKVSWQAPTGSWWQRFWHNFH